MAAGELREGLDLEVTLDLIYGPIYYRLLVGHASLDRGFTDALLGQAMAGLAAKADALRPFRLGQCPGPGALPATTEPTICPAATGPRLDGRTVLRPTLGHSIGANGIPTRYFILSHGGIRGRA